MKYSYSIVPLFLLSCGQKTTNDQSSQNKDTTKAWHPEWVKDNTDSRDSMVKFQPGVSFEDFQVNEIYSGPKTKVNIHSSATAKMFRTALRTGYDENGLNFAGHYCLVYWGCGSPCKESAIIDLKTGIVYDGPSAAQDYDFRKESRMVVTDPPGDDGYYVDCIFCTPAVWIWSEQKKRFYQYKSKIK